MTREELERLSDRELDLLVAEKVMGESMTLWRMANEAADNPRMLGPDLYTTDGNAMLDVIAKLLERGVWLAVWVGEEEPTVAAKAGKEFCFYVDALGKSVQEMPRAVAIAALLALEGAE